MDELVVVGRETVVVAILDDDTIEISVLDLAIFEANVMRSLVDPSDTVTPRGSIESESFEDDVLSRASSPKIERTGTQRHFFARVCGDPDCMFPRGPARDED